MTIPKLEIPDHHANQPQGRVPDGGRHAAHLVILAFDEFQGDPAIRDGFAGPDRRVTRSDLRLWVEHPYVAGERLVIANLHAGRQLRQSVACRDALDLRPITPPMTMAGMQEPIDQRPIIAEEQEPFALRVEPSDRRQSLLGARSDETGCGRSLGLPG